MLIALIGHTGFVGSNLLRSLPDAACFNSRNIAEIRGRTFDLVINAGVSSLRWKANQEPEQDRAGIVALWEHLQTVTTERLLHISTLDVLSGKGPQYEDSPIDRDALLPYGRHRLELEEWIAERFAQHLIVRYPHLYGRGLKKNFLWDLMHDNVLHLTDERDVFQFYHLDDLWTDLQVFLGRNLKLVHVSVAPLSAGEVARECFGREFTNRCQRDPRFYDLRTRLDYRKSRTEGYMYTREETIRALRDFQASFPRTS